VAHGLNMQRAGRALIWYALTWDLELHDKLIKRIHRQGQTKRVFVHYVIARGTVDEALMSAIQRKTRTQQGLLNALRAYYLPPPSRGRGTPQPGQGRAGRGTPSRGRGGAAGTPPSRGK
jgi:SNF2 family DNA or RNA helicase